MHFGTLDEAKQLCEKLNSIKTVKSQIRIFRGDVTQNIARVLISRHVSMDFLSNKSHEVASIIRELDDRYNK